MRALNPLSVTEKTYIRSQYKLKAVSFIAKDLHRRKKTISDYMEQQGLPERKRSGNNFGEDHHFKRMNNNLFVWIERKKKKRNQNANN